MFSGRTPPARNTGRDASATSLWLSDQSCKGLVRPSSLIRSLRPAGIEQEGVDRERPGLRLIKRLGAGDVDYLDDLHPRRGPMHFPVGRGLNGVDDLNRIIMPQRRT